MAGYAPTLKRHELEDRVEDVLLEIAESLVPAAPEKEDLKAARKYHPTFFGGLFPTLGLAVTRTQGSSAYVDKPDRPGLLVVEVKIYYPCMPVMGAQSRQDDRTGPAKRITRRMRGLFLEKVFASPLGAYVEVVETRGGSVDEVGNAVTDERGREILFIDRTQMSVSA